VFGSQPRRLYEAWCGYIKAAHGAKGEMRLLPQTTEAAARVFFMHKDFSVSQLIPGTPLLEIGK